MEAAFFDLDKTVIAKPSIMAFARDFRREGLLTRRTMLKGLWVQLIYVRVGAGHKRLHRVRRSVLAATTGWDQAHVRRVVTEGLAAAIDPITYIEARDLIDEHRSAGRRVYLVSAAPSEIVEPLAYHLGAHEALASVARVDQDGRYTGDVERYAYGPEKASLIRRVAAQNGIDLSGSVGLHGLGYGCSDAGNRGSPRRGQPGPGPPAHRSTTELGHRPFHSNPRADNSGIDGARTALWVGPRSSAVVGVVQLRSSSRRPHGGRGRVAWRSRTQAQLGAT